MRMDSSNKSSHVAKLQVKAALILSLILESLHSHPQAQTRAVHPPARVIFQ